MGIARFAVIAMVTIVLCIGCTSRMQHDRNESSIEDESVDLGEAEWTIGHEIALVDDRREPFVYRIRLRLEANPYSTSAVTILGVD